MEFNSTGKKLKIFIHCQSKFEHGWMSYISWYSICKTLPQADVTVVVEESDQWKRYFAWAEKCKVEINSFSGDLEEFSSESPYLIINPNVMAVRELDDKWLKILSSDRRISFADKMFYYGGLASKDYLGSDVFCADVRANSSTSFISYENFGNFVLSQWIDNNTCPFSFYKKFKIETDNSSKLLDFWCKSAPTYITLEGK